jgi:hypothetical protein
METPMLELQAAVHDRLDTLSRTAATIRAERDDPGRRPTPLVATLIAVRRAVALTLVAAGIALLPSAADVAFSPGRARGPR